VKIIWSPLAVDQIAAIAEYITLAILHGEQAEEFLKTQEVRFSCVRD